MITPEKIQKQCDLLADLLKRKNADYGDSFSEAPYLLPSLLPSTATLVRLSDKFRRLRTLWKEHWNGKQNQVDESLEDTLRDIAGYCVLLLVSVAAEEGEKEE